MNKDGLRLKLDSLEKGVAGIGGEVIKTEICDEFDSLTTKAEALERICEPIKSMSAAMRLDAVHYLRTSWPKSAASLEAICDHLDSQQKPCEHRMKKGQLTCNDCGAVLQSFEDYPGLPKKSPEERLREILQPWLITGQRSILIADILKGFKLREHDGE